MLWALTWNRVNHLIPQLKVFGIIIESRDKCSILGEWEISISVLYIYQHSFLFSRSSVIAINLLSTDEILRAGRSSLKPDGGGA